MFIEDLNSLEFSFEVENQSLVTGLQCFGNITGEWESVELIKDESKISFSKNVKFSEGRRRINCTSKFKDDWYWFGYQILIK